MGKDKHNDSKENDFQLKAFIDHHVAFGRYAFSWDYVSKQLPWYTETGLKSALKRLIAKGKILSIHQTYYLIITPQYSGKGILPVTLFLDGLMEYLEKAYYVGLLNAASFHGATHQQPQEYFVITTFPVIRTTNKKGIKINYISVKEIPEGLIEKRKTEAGYLNISNPALTATDIIQYEKRIGGINRAATILIELMEVIKPQQFNTLLLRHAHVSVLQRLGYLLEFVCHNVVLANALMDAMLNQNLKWYKKPLKTGIKTDYSLADNRWKVILNMDIEIDE